MLERAIIFVVIEGVGGLVPWKGQTCQQDLPIFPAGRGFWCWPEGSAPGTAYSSPHTGGCRKEWQTVVTGYALHITPFSRHKVYIPVLGLTRHEILQVGIYFCLICTKYYGKAYAGANSARNFTGKGTYIIFVEDFFKFYSVHNYSIIMLGISLWYNGC